MPRRTSARPARTFTAAPPVEVTWPNFSDTDPHPWAGQDPAQHPVHGVDVSRFQTSVDWEVARANGVNFAFIKATEGGDLLDPMFEDHWRGASAWHGAGGPLAVSRVSYCWRVAPG